MFYLKKNKILRMVKFEYLIPGTKNEIFAHVVLKLEKNHRFVEMDKWKQRPKREYKFLPERNKYKTRYSTFSRFASFQRTPQDFAYE